MKTIFITGAGRGIGRAICEEALKRGYTVHGLVRKPGLAPAGVHEHVADLRDRPAVKSIIEKLAPQIDCYIANAGMGHTLKPREADAAEKAAEVMEVNGTATIFSMYAMAHEWIRLEARGKRIAVISSLAAGLGLPKSSVYSASKTAQLLVCQGLDHDLARYGIAVSVVQPGFIETDMSAALPGRPFLISAQKAALKILDGLERGSHRIVFPQSTASLAWFTHHLPGFILRQAIRQLQKRKML